MIELLVEGREEFMVEVSDGDMEVVLDMSNGARFGPDLVASLQEGWLGEGSWCDFDAVRDEYIAVDFIAKLGWQLEEPEQSTSRRILGVGSVGGRHRKV
ncbi:hypothetical protein CLAFUW4_09513 [Fulvia fulva]|uniref:Uncharacterized protein n=1 Tax=Passalora fulva TaxID=5499 RepID=A0A9Q8PFL9_PASFU|nr:uncharacterized protein CLAFUR5_09610 [Fulvia fulva]KAK4613778.1 hypothetical protein CLAFUR4_09519 [Fulvia fulva]KAK4614710.1 hypothetical protein CLAFUR0_09510 [Fulvia fulva]UJO21704.1 hypothetical protein CLAFUR5_09610 [Fulvia fulva]WPV20184.1 hypothetical protein CLAFUW4_09513 [Fulvia fulva]WPV34842.1 hypothetical protein CLAFUW7_09514 [Fulvia fulva]